eukprot:tig00020660_g12513.t1
MFVSALCGACVSRGPRHAALLRPALIGRALRTSAQPKTGGAQRHAHHAAGVVASADRAVEPASESALPPPLLSVAPMMDYTDKNMRYMMRLLTRKTWLYTEMVVDSTIVHNPVDNDRWLGYHPVEHPVVLQLGGSRPDQLREATRIASARGYDEINLNCGCPSDKVSGKGCFGASLMLDPQRVADITAAMNEVASVPVTVKCRIGVDDRDSYEELAEFVSRVSEGGGVRHFVVHARKALLNSSLEVELEPETISRSSLSLVSAAPELDGLSPHDNRTIPPLKYDVVYRLMEDFPGLLFSINGGIKTLAAAREHLQRGVHGVMIGRAAYENPFYVFANADACLYGAENPSLSRREVLELYGEFGEVRMRETRQSRSAIIKPVLGLFTGDRGARAFRRAVDTGLKAGKGVAETLRAAAREMPDEILDFRFGPRGEGSEAIPAAGGAEPAPAPAPAPEAPEAPAGAVAAL